MKKVIFLFFVLLSTQYSISQENYVCTTVDYYYYFNQIGSSASYPRNCRLIINENASLYEIFDVEASSNEPERYNSDKGTAVVVLKPKKNRFYYKDLKNKTITNRERIFIEKFFVLDSLDNLFEWKLTQKRKNILGYDCQEATTEFRGRKYTAYFTPEIPVQNGPWKFHGLPGLILEVSMDKNTLVEFSITAENVEFSKERCDVINPYADKKTYSRKKYEDLYKKKYDEITSYQGEGGVSYGMSKGLIEVIIEE